jgi:competence protein ComEC
MARTAHGYIANRTPVENVVARPLVGVTAVFTAGLLVGGTYPGHTLFIGMLLLPATVVCLRCVATRTPGCVAPLILFGALGYLAIQPWLGSHLPEDHLHHFIGRGKLQLQGIVAGRPRVTTGRMRFVLEADRLSNAQGDQRIRGKARVTVRGEPPELRRGDRVQVTGYLYDIRNFNNPGGFDYERYMALQGIRVRMSARAPQMEVLHKADTSGGFLSLHRWLDNHRQALGNAIDGALAHHGGRAAAILKALIVGDRSGITPELRDDFNRAGVGHVLAISGLHIGMVAATVFWVAVNIFGWVPGLLQQAWTRRAAALTSMLAVGGYALLAGMSSSTQRAAIMASVFLMTYWIGRRHDWLNAAALAALMIVLFHPPAVFGISFQLSFSAVLAILGGMQYFTSGYVNADRSLLLGWGRRVMLFTCVSALAIVGTLPLVMSYFNQVSVVGVVVNMAVVPLVGWVVLPFGLAGALADLVSPGMAYLFWQVAAVGTDAVLSIAAWVAGWPHAAVKTITPSLSEILIYYLMVIVFLNWQRLPRRKIVLALLMVLAMVDASYWIYQRHFRQDLRVTVLDVGQGSANLLQLPGGATVLVDGGGFGDNAVFDVGRSIVAPYLWRQKIKTLDLVVLSHPNSDHLNGLIYILEHFDVTAVWSNHEPAATKGYRQLMEVIRAHHIEHPAFQRLPRRQMRYGVIFEILAPEVGFLDRRSRSPWRNENEDSLVLRVSKGEDAFLFCGDIGQRTESVLLEHNGEGGLKSTMLLVPHHGSRYSSSLAFLKAVAPQQAVVSCGWRNRYRFPHPDVLQRLDELSCEVWRTDLDGAIRLSTRGKGIRVQPYLNRKP